MKESWNQRYSSKEFAYGKEPNGFFASHLEDSAPGTILLPGEGEGRNAVYAAMKGWSAEAFDQSETGRDKAISLASGKGLKIQYDVCRVTDFLFKPNYYDFAALIFFHTDPPDREYLHRKVYEALKPGGTLVLEAFHKEQRHNTTGGPKSEDLLFDEEMLRSDFAPFEKSLIEKQKVILNEGPFHQGEALVIRFSGKKPE